MAEIWTKLTARAKREDLDGVCAIMCMLDSGLMIEDYSDVTTDGMYGALIDESILNADKEHVEVSIFVSEDKSLPEYTAFLSERLNFSGIDAEIRFEGVSEEDWAESWKKYYKPISLGKITIVPAWEEYKAREGELILRMDPKMAFGTGTHETTRLVIELMQGIIKDTDRVLDMGCGSGILAICASKLGAKECAAYDLDPVAVKVAKENVEADGATNVTCGTSDLFDSVDLSKGKYDIILANIVADIILRMLPDMEKYLADDGKIILSGIIEPRGEEIYSALAENGYSVIDTKKENDWLAIIAEKEKN